MDINQSINQSINQNLFLNITKKYISIIIITIIKFKKNGYNVGQGTTKNVLIRVDKLSRP